MCWQASAWSTSSASCLLCTRSTMTSRRWCTGSTRNCVTGSQTKRSADVPGLPRWHTIALWELRGIRGKGAWCAENMQNILQFGNRRCESCTWTNSRIQRLNKRTGMKSVKSKVLPEPQGPLGGADLRFLSPQPDTSLHCETWDHRCGDSVLHGVPVYSPAFASTYYAYPRRDGQAELTWVAGYIPRWFIHLHGHLSKNVRTA